VINELFFSPFYGQYKIKNYKELVSVIEKNLDSFDSHCNWNSNCNVDVKYIDNYDFIIPFIEPCIKQFCEDIDRKLYIEFYGRPWISSYSYESFQEVHQHGDSDLSCVFFMNSGIDFAKFYFLNRHGNDFSDVWIREIFSNEMADTFFPDVTEGDLIIFPSHLLHGVGVHKSEELRKSLAFNMRIK